MSYTLLSETKPKARKPYRCIWCPEIILKGELHIHETSIFDGEFQNHRWHPECHAVSQSWFRVNNQEEFEAHQCKRGTTEEA